MRATHCLPRLCAVVVHVLTTVRGVVGAPTSSSPPLADVLEKWTSSRACKAASNNVSRAKHERARQVSLGHVARQCCSRQSDGRARAELVQSARGARCLREFGARAPRRRTTPRPMTKRRARRSPPAARTGSGPIGRLPRERTPGVLQKPARPPERRVNRVQSDRTIPSAASERRMTQPRVRDPRSSSYPAAGRDGPQQHSLWSRCRFPRVLRDSAPTPRASSALDQHRCVACARRCADAPPRHRARARA